MASVFDDVVDDSLGPALADEFGVTATATIGGASVAFTAAAVPERGQREDEQAAGGRSTRVLREIVYQPSAAALTPRTPVVIDGVNYAVLAIERLGGTWSKATLERAPLIERTRPGYRG